MDAAGRVLISPTLRDHAEFEKTVILVGIGKKFELWSKAAWDKTQAEMPALTPGMLPPELEGLSF